MDNIFWEGHFISAEEGWLFCDQLSDQQWEGNGREHHNECEDQSQNLSKLDCNNHSNKLPNTKAHHNQCREVYYPNTQLEISLLKRGRCNVEDCIHCEEYDTSYVDCSRGDDIREHL